jgi:hypothetical protein
VSAATDAVLLRILKTNEATLLDEWLKEQLGAFRAAAKISETELRGRATARRPRSAKDGRL